MGMINDPLRRLTVGTLRSAAEVSNLAESLRKPGPSGMQTEWAFRGQPGTYGSLVPAFRRMFPKGGSTSIATELEAELIRSFRLHYARLYKPSSGLPEPSLIGGENELACMSVMQHYGVPTRMLDWTKDFWVATYFACSGEHEQDAELWIYDRRMFWPAGTSAINEQSSPPQEKSQKASTSSFARISDLQGQLLYEMAPVTSPRLRYQSGHHTVSSDIFAEHAIRLDRLRDNPNNPPSTQPRFRRHLIAKVAKPNILTYLEQFHGISAASIYPDLEGLSMFLRMQLRSLVTLLHAGEA